MSVAYGTIMLCGHCCSSQLSQLGGTINGFPSMMASIVFYGTLEDRSQEGGFHVRYSLKTFNLNFYTPISEQGNKLF